MADKSKKTEKPQYDEQPSTSRGARRKTPKSKGNKVDGDVYFTPNTSEDCVTSGIMPDPKLSRKPPSGKIVPSFKSIVSEGNVLQARRTDASFKSVMTVADLPEAKRRSTKRLRSIPERDEKTPVDFEHSRPSTTSQKYDEATYREAAEKLIAGNKINRKTVKDDEQSRPSETIQKDEEPSVRKPAEQPIGGKKKKRRLKQKYLEKKKDLGALDDDTKSVVSLSNQLKNYDGPFKDDTRSMHMIHAAPKPPISSGTSSSTLSDNESIIWATTYSKKQEGSQETVEWKHFKRVMKGDDEDSSSTTESDELIFEQKLEEPSSHVTHDAPKAEGFAQRFKIPLMEFLQKWTKKPTEDETTKEPEEPSTSHPKVIKGKRIGDDVYFTPRESEASFYSLMSPISRRSHRFSPRRTVTSFRSPVSVGDLPDSRDPSFKSAFSSDLAERRRLTAPDETLNVEKTVEVVEQPDSPKQSEKTKPTEEPELIEPNQQTEPTVPTERAKKHRKGKVPKNLAHIEDLDDKISEHGSLIPILSVNSGENDDINGTSTSSSSITDSETFLWSGKYGKRMQKVASEESQIQEWVTFKRTPKKVTNYDEDYDTESSELIKQETLGKDAGEKGKEGKQSKEHEISASTASKGDELQRDKEAAMAGDVKKQKEQETSKTVDGKSSEKAKAVDDTKQKDHDDSKKEAHEKKKEVSLKGDTQAAKDAEDPKVTEASKKVEDDKKKVEKASLVKDLEATKADETLSDREQKAAERIVDDKNAAEEARIKKDDVDKAMEGVQVEKTKEPPDNAKPVSSHRSAKHRTTTHFRRGGEQPRTDYTHIKFDDMPEATPGHHPRTDPDEVLLRRSHETPRLSTIKDEEAAALGKLPLPNADNADVKRDGEADPDAGIHQLTQRLIAHKDDVDKKKDHDEDRGSQLSLLRRSHEAPRLSTIKDEQVTDIRIDHKEKEDRKDEHERPHISIKQQQNEDNKEKRQTYGNISSSSSDDGFRAKLKAFGSKLQTNLIMGNAFIYMIIPPDGGFGWIIMFISFLCQVIVDGIIFGVGLLLPDMAKDLGVDSQTITLVASMQIGCYFLAGSFASAFINRYGFRPVAFFGAVASVITIILSTFSPNLTTLIILYSLIGGPTLSMIWVSSQLIIGYYFERNRPVANGISCSGAGAGIVIFCAMNSFLVPEIGWRNTSRVHAMILSSVLLLCMTYVEVKPTRVGQVKELELETESDHSSSEEYEVRKTYRYSKAFSLRQSVQSVPEQKLNDMLEMYVEVPKKKPGICSRIFGDCCGGPRTKTKDADFESGMARGFVIRHDPIERQDLFYTGPAEYDRHEGDGTEILDNKQVELLRGTEHSVKQVNYNLSMMHAAREPPARRKTYQELKARNVRNPMLAYLKPSNLVHPKIRAAFRKLFDFRLLTIMEFQVLCASAFLFPMGFNIPFVYSKVRAEVDPFYASFISPSIGASGFIFRIISGFLAQRHRSWTTYLCGGGMFFGGFSVFVSAFYGHDKVWFQYLYGACYGVAPAFYSTLRAIIYVRSLGLEKLTNAFGMTALAMGCGVFVGTTLAGIMNQQTGGYTASFAFGGICIMTSGTLKLILPSLIKWKEERDSRGKRVTFK